MSARGKRKGGLPSRPGRAAAVALLCLLGSCTAVDATGIGGDLWGVVIDPLKLGKASDTISASLERTMIELAQLESRGNKDAKARLDQVDQIVADVNVALANREADVQKIADDALQRANDLESRTALDVVNSIYAARCVPEVAIDQLNRAVASIVSELRRANPGVKFLGIRWGGLDFSQVKVDDPDQVYRSIKAIYLKRLDGLDENSDPYTIVSVYENLARLARLTLCNYHELYLQAEFLDEAVEFDRKARPWLALGVQP